MGDVISFAWTTAALQAGHKGVTRRGWRHTYAQRFKAGLQVAAFDKSRRNNGRQIGWIRLTEDAKFENMRDMPREDYWREGFAWIHEHPEFAPPLIFGEKAGAEAFTYAAFEKMRAKGAEDLWTVRFEVVDMAPVPEFSRLLRPEIVVAARYWANQVVEHALKTGPLDSAEMIHSALCDSIASSLGAYGAHPLKLHERVPVDGRSVEPALDLTWTPQIHDPILVEAIASAGLDGRFDGDALPYAVVNIWPGHVEVSREVVGIESATVLFSCMPSEVGPAGAGG